MLPYTRREFAKFALAAFPAAGALTLLNSARGADHSPKAGGKPNSKYAGVQLGLNVPYSFSNPAMTGDEVLKNCVQLGLSAVELRTQPVEAFLGVPANLVSAKGAVASGGAAQSNAEQLKKWRSSAPVDRAKEFRKK